VAGSAYTFSYATIGELPAWIIGWDLMLELALGAATVAVGWSGYANILLDDLGLKLPSSIAGEDATFNVPAMLVVLVVTALLVLGVKISSRVNAVIVAIKIAVVLLVIFAGLFFIKGANYSPFIPEAVSSPELHGGKAPLIQVLFGYTPSTFGWSGIFAGAAIVFFAFIGFDVVATAAEETKKPKRDLPIGIIASLLICTILYVAVSLVVTVISVGALAGLTTVVLILMLGQSRVFFAMSRDGLLPSWLAQVHPRYGTPYRVTIIIGVAVALIAGLVPLSALAELVNIGTLFAFIVVSAGIVILRRTHPDLPRSFRVPASPLLPFLAVVACGYLMLNLPVETWLRFVIWMITGFVVYFLYGRGHSRVGMGRTESG
jgi:APA family basic amino acid/polyamine antiporter